MGLFDFLNKIPTLNEIKGSFGEWLAKIYSKTMPGVLALHDVLIDGAENATSQIDLVLIGNRGIYVVEVKMFAEAKIYGNTKSSKWSYYLHGKKYEIYSPIKQNKKHIEHLKKFLEPFGEIPCYSIVTMICDGFKISGEFDGSMAICNSLPAMEKAIYKIAEGKPEILDDAKKQAIFEHIKENQHIGKEVRRNHKDRVVAYKTELDNMNKQKICPYCKTELVLRNGKNGEFYGCKNYPKCRYTCKK